MRYLVLICLIATGCTRGDYGKNDGKVVCNLTGEAFRSEEGAGQISFLQRLKEADALCSKLRGPGS